MGIAEDIYDRSTTPEPSRLCKLGLLRETLDEADSEALDYAVERCRKDAATAQQARIFTITWLRETLASNGHPIGKTVISEHVRKVCACEQSGE